MGQNPLPIGINLLRRCSDCNCPLGNRDRFCPRCGTRQPREPKSHAPAIAGIVLSACAAGALAADTARDYPSRPVRLMVTFPAGGGVDLMARMLGQKLADSWGQQFVI